MNYRQQLDKATKRAFRQARRKGTPVTWKHARDLGVAYLSAKGTYPQRAPNEVFG